MKSSQEAVSSYLVATCSLFYITLVKSCHEMNELLRPECPVVEYIGYCMHAVLSGL